MIKKLTASRLLSTLLIFTLCLSLFVGCGEKRPPDDSSLNGDDSSLKDNEDHLASGGKAYSSQFVYDGLFYDSKSDDCFYWAPADDPDNTAITCPDPLCKHRDETCMAKVELTNYQLIFPKDGSLLPYLLSLGKEDSEDLRGLRGVLYLHDMETGEKRELFKGDFSNITNAMYIDGRIYITAYYDHGGVAQTVAMYDMKTGEFKELEDVEKFCTIAGVYDGRLYFYSGRGVLYSCDLDLDDVREFYDAGYSIVRPFKGFTNFAYVSDGLLYFERNCREMDELQGDEWLNSKFHMVSDVYVIDLRDPDAGERLVSENVREFKACDGDLYFTKWDYKSFTDITTDKGRVVVVNDDNGTFYRYDGKTGETTTCFADSGITMMDLYDVNGGYAVFYGQIYKGLENGMKYENVWPYRAIVNIETGEWHRISSQAGGE